MTQKKPSDRAVRARSLQQHLLLEFYERARSGKSRTLLYGELAAPLLADQPTCLFFWAADDPFFFELC